MPADPEPPMDPIEALRVIRVHIEATGDLAEGSPVSSIYREIRAVLDKALGPSGQRRKARRPDA